MRLLSTVLLSSLASTVLCQPNTAVLTNLAPYVLSSASLPPITTSTLAGSTTGATTIGGGLSSAAVGSSSSSSSSSEGLSSFQQAEDMNDISVNTLQVNTQNISIFQKMQQRQHEAQGMYYNVLLQYQCHARNAVLKHIFLMHCYCSTKFRF